MNLLEAKLLTMSVLGLVSIVLGMIPMFIVRKLGLATSATSDVMSPTTRTLISGILCFGGGVLMGTGFLHMLPEVHEGWQKYTQDNHIDVNLALGIVVICAGFFLVYFVEELAHLMADRHAHNKTDVSIHRAVSIRGCPVSLEGPSPPCESSCQKANAGQATCQDSTICQLDCEDKEFCKNVAEGEGCSASKPCCSSKGVIQSTVIHKLNSVEKNLQNDGYGTFSLIESDLSHSDHDHQPENSQLGSQSVHHGSESSTVHVPPLHRSLSGGHHSHDLHHHHGLMMENGHCVGAPLRGLLFIIALSLHEVLEGVAVGLQKNQSGVLQLFAAVASHKFVISFCVGLELSTSGVKLLMHTIYILVFSLVTPLGIGIGIAMTMTTHSSGEENPADSLSSLIMQGLACGTILYVAFFEILERERSKSTVGLFQWTLLVLGFLSIMGLQLLITEPISGVDETTEVIIIPDVST